MLDRLDLATMVSDSRPGLWNRSKYLAPLRAPSLRPLSMPLRTAEDRSFAIEYTLATDTANEISLEDLVMAIKRRGFGRAMKPRHLAAARAHTVRNLADLPPGLPALHIAICGCGIQFMSLLLEHGANPNQLCGAYPIQLAARPESLEMVNILIQYGCVVDGHAVSTDRYCEITHNLEQELLLNPRQPAICDAWGDQQFDIVQNLLKAGAKFPEHDKAMIRHDSTLGLYCRTSDGKEVGGIESRDYFDPWVVAIRFNSIAGLCMIIQGQDEYIGHGMSTANLARCILIHGISYTSEFILNRDLLESDERLDPLILSALTYAGDEVMAKKVTRTLIDKIGPSKFVQQYGAKALFLAVVKGYDPLVQFFLESGVNPFAQGPEFPCADLWRMDR
jgi:hypothetical protein